VELEVTSHLAADGRLEPKSTTFAGGFRLTVKKSLSDPRLRFTIAHEVCHTFFYEFVPEMKFVPHDVDQDEERLCNFGAAELLMPMESVQRDAAALPVSMKSLESLARTYGVSLEAMLRRLRSLQLWRCQLSIWYRMTNGELVLNRLYGGKHINWRWVDESIVGKALTERRNSVSTGRTFIGYQDNIGCLRVAPVYYQLLRSGNSILALWSRHPFADEPDNGSLFENPRQKRGRMARKGPRNRDGARELVELGKQRFKL
jgi:hypothetical protein